MKRNHLLAVAALAVFTPVAAAMGQIELLSAGVDQHSGSGRPLSGTVLIRNSTKEPQEARVYLTDYVFTADGRTT